MGVQDIALAKIKQVEVISTLKEESIKSILNKYEILASIKYGETSEDVLYSNDDLYSVILLPVVYKTIYNIVGSKTYNQFKGSVPKIDSILNDKEGRDKFFGGFGKKLIEHGSKLDELEELSEEKIEHLLNTFGIEEAEEDDDIYIIEDDDLEEDIDLDDIIETSDTDDKVKNTEDSQIEALKRTWGDKLDIVVSGIMNTYNRLYASGYGLVSPCGVLTNIGAVRSTTDGRVIQAGNRALDVELFRAITSVLKGNYELYAENDKEPDIFEIERAGVPIIYVGMHLEFMFGHIRFCKGIGRYIKEHNINNESTTKIIKWSDMSGYVREKVEGYFYNAYIKYGVTSEANENDIQITNKINNELSRNLKNVIILAERQKGVNTRVRIASDSNIDTDRLINTLNSVLNVGTDSSIAVRQVGEYADGVLDINVVYNERKFSQDTLFAYQVLDKLEEQGIRPRWDNVILGKKDDGTIMTYNFKDKRNAVYAIYAATGAGKGVMTLNLIASAIADLCKILYIDGKPDMGEVLADIAWKNGVEAPIYNGVSGKGSEMLENRGTSIRKESPFMDVDSIPDGVFLTDNEKEKYMLITTYLRGIELLCDIAAYRSSQDLPGNDWVTAFVDECEQAAVAEIDVVECLDRAENNRKGAKDENGKRINAANDEITQFVRGYKAWQQSIKSKFKTCITSTFRYANMTMMFIWQSTKFPEQYKNKSIIAGVIDASSGVITKIFGRGAAVAYGSKVFGTPTSLENASWYDGRFTNRGGGYFAIGKDVTSNSMEVFRPFNIYSDANHKELIIENAKAVGISEDDLRGVSLDNSGNVIPEVGFEGYITKMLLNYGITVGEQLASSYEYFNTFIKRAGVYNNLNEYMFDCHRFNGGESSNRNEYFTNRISIDSSESEQQSDIYNAQDVNDEFGNIEFDNIASADDIGGYNGAVNELNKRRVNEYRNVINRAYEDKFNGGDNLSYEPEIEYVNSTVGVEYENGRVKIRDTSGFTPIDINKEDFIEPDRSSSTTVSRFMDKLMANRYGMNYNFKQRWNFILNAISNAFPRDNMITKVHIMMDMIMVNNKIVNISEMLDNEYGIMLDDIVNFSELLRRFMSIRELVVDQESFRWLTREFYGEQNGIYKAFNIGRSLEAIKIDNQTGTIYEITRDGKNAKETSRKQSEEEFRQQIDQMSAGYDNRIEKRGAVYMDRISRKSFGFTKNNWGRVKNNFIANNGKRHIIKGTMWLGVAAVTGLIGGMFLGGKKLVTAFSK